METLCLGGLASPSIAHPSPEGTAFFLSLHCGRHQTRGAVPEERGGSAWVGAGTQKWPHFALDWHRGILIWMPFICFNGMSEATVDGYSQRASMAWSTSENVNQLLVSEVALGSTMSPGDAARIGIHSLTPEVVQRRGYGQELLYWGVQPPQDYALDLTFGLLGLNPGGVTD